VGSGLLADDGPGGSPGSALDPTEPDVPEDLHPSTLHGTCFLAILPSGHMSGHMVVGLQSNDREPTGRTLGLVARCIAMSSSGRPGCKEDNDMDFLKISIINLEV